MPATPESHSGRYFALLYASATERPVLESLFGIEHQVFDSLRAGLDHHVAHTRLQWWQEECERAANGRPVHPLTKGLVIALNAAGAINGGAATSSVLPAAVAAASDRAMAGSRATAVSGPLESAPLEPSSPQPGSLEPASLEPADFASTLSAIASSADLASQPRAVRLPGLAGLCGIVDVSVWDLAGATFETRRELNAYCERWAAGMIEPLVARLPTSPTSVARTTDWRALGAAMREVELLTELDREAHYGRIRIPLDELERANVDTSALAKPPWSNAIAELLRARHKSLRDDIARILTNVDREQQPSLRGLLVWAALTWRSSQRAERALPERLRPGRYDAISDAWFAWRIARRATSGRFRLN